SPSTLFASASGGVMKSSDGGSTWSPIATFGRGVSPMALDMSSETSTRPPTIYFTVTDFERNAFVTEINSTGSALVFSTFLGGIQRDWGGSNGAGIALDAQDNVYIAGSTLSPYFPLLNPYQGSWPCANCRSNAFVTKLGNATLPAVSGDSV